MYFLSIGLKQETVAPVIYTIWSCKMAYHVVPRRSDGAPHAIIHPGGTPSAAGIDVFTGYIGQ